MQVAIYTRVSTERQEREQTIESQLAVLRAWVEANGHTLDPEHVFLDEGYSGARLDRPGLDRLRDAVQDGDVGAVVVLSPDRLARKYVYQVLLLEEFQRAGCQVVFVHRPIGEDPSDQLLLQIQGAIAEYERALLGERFRRGKLQRARAGQYLSSRAPYGYRYVPKREGVPGHLVIDEAEADLVRTMYSWLIDERMSIRQILKRLNFGPHRPRCGRLPWSASTVHHILADPIYSGTAYSNRYRYVPPKRPRERGVRTRLKRAAASHVRARSGFRSRYRPSSMRPPPNTRKSSSVATRCSRFAAIRTTTTCCVASFRVAHAAWRCSAGRTVRRRLSQRASTTPATARIASSALANARAHADQ